MTIGQIRKAIIATFAAAATWGVTAALDGEYTAIEWWGLLGALVAAIAVYEIPNDRPSVEVLEVEVVPNTDHPTL